MYWPYELDFCLWIVAWILTVWRIARGRSSVGLGIAFLALLGLVHFSLHFLFCIGNYSGPESDESVNGFRLTGLGVAGYIVGVLLYDLRLRARPARPAGRSAVRLTAAHAAEIRRTAFGYISMWLIFFLIGLTGFYRTL